MKMPDGFIPVCLSVLLAFPAVVSAQSSEKSPTPIQASVSGVTDHRSTDEASSKCTVNLTFTGDAAADAVKVLHVTLAEADDEVGRDLTDKEDDQFSEESFDSRHSSGALKAWVTLRNPSRNAATIKILQGTVELFSPTVTNGGLLTIKDVLRHPAEPLPSPELAKYGIQLMYLTKEAYAAKKKEIKAQQSAADAAAEQKLDEAFGKLFKGMPSPKNSIQMYVSDPEKLVISLKFVNGFGRPLKSRESWSADGFMTTGLNVPPPADTQLIVQLATPEAVKSYPFQVENIPLP